jgi:phosphonate transport system substrate-binding protein
MAKVTRRLACLLLAALAAAPLPARGGEARAQPAGERLVIGLIPEMNLFKQKARFKLLGEYVSRKVGVPVEFRILSRYGNIVDSFQSERMDGAFFGSFTGALAIEKLGVVPLARPVNLDGLSTYHGHLFVRRDSPFRSIADLRGRRMAFVDRATTAGYVFPLALLRENGLGGGPAFFGESWFTGSHDAAIHAVLEGKADAGVAKHSIYDRLRAADPRVDRELRILAESPPVPSNGLCVRPGLPPALVEKLQRALLGLDKDPEGAVVLGQFGALRFIETSVEDYRPVVEMARSAGIDLKTYEYLNQ